MWREVVRTNEYRRSILIGLVVGLTGGSRHPAIACVGGAVMAFLLWKPEEARIRALVNAWSGTKWLLVGFCWGGLLALERLVQANLHLDNFVAMLLSAGIVAVIRVLVIAFDVEL